jgi:pyruvate dehydrogenase E2 component (dihydrolipoamide acetyltransferase)
MGNMKLRKLKRVSAYRALAASTWKAPNDPHVYGSLDLDMTLTMPFLDWYRKEHGAHVTLTHLVIKAIADAVREHPEINGIIRWRRIYLREEVDIFCNVVIPGPKPDLSGVMVRKADEKSLADICEVIRQHAELIRTNRDPEMKKTKSLLRWMPNYFVGWFMRLITFLSYDLNLNLSRLGLVPRDPFGGILVTSVAGFGLTGGFAPLVTFTRQPLILLVGEVADRPVVKDDHIVIAPILPIFATFDHRFMDGIVAGRMVKSFRPRMENPEQFYGAQATSQPEPEGEATEPTEPSE